MLFLKCYGVGNSRSLLEVSNARVNQSEGQWLESCLQRWFKDGIGGIGWGGDSLPPPKLKMPEDAGAPWVIPKSHIGSNLPGFIWKEILWKLASLGIPDFFTCAATFYQQLFQKALICTIAATAVSAVSACPTLCDPMEYSLPGSSVHGIFQARVLEWVAISSPQGIFPNQGEPLFLTLRQIPYHRATWEACNSYNTQIQM